MIDIVTKYEMRLRKIAFWAGALCIVAGSAISMALVIPLSLQSVANVNTALPGATSTPITLSFSAAPGTCDSGKVVLSWQLGSGATGYRLYRETTVIYDGNNTTFTDSQLLPGSSHTYYLAAYDTSNTLGTATTNATAPSLCATTVSTSTVSVTPPLAPTGLKLVPSTSCGVPDLILSWDAVLDASGYRVLRNGTVVSDSPNLQYDDHSLSLSTSYSYTVYAYNTLGVSAGSSIGGTTAPACTSTGIASSTTATTTPNAPLIPSAPTNLKAEVGSCGEPTVKLSWQGVNNVYGYRVYRNDAQMASITGNSYTDAAAVFSTTYTYSVVAVNTYGASPAAITQVTTPLSCVTTASTTTSHDAVVSPTTPNTVSLAGDSPTKDASTTGVTNPAPQTPPTPISPVVPTTKFSLSVVGVDTAIEDLKKAANDAETELLFVINKNTDNLVAEKKGKGLAVDIAKINAARDVLIQKVHASLDSATTISLRDISVLGEEIKAGIIAMRLEAGDTKAVAESSTGDVTHAIAGAVGNLLSTVKEQSASQAAHEVALLYKDSNNDGISDYDSVHVYNLNPNTPSPVSDYNGKKITAADKILLGFDPAKKELISITAEEPASSSAPVVPTYKVDHIDLANAKQVVFKGRALPNTFLTLYIYSTPIIVTVKANANGEWQYTLDKELESGTHTIYTATVNNSGKILAKSPGFLFTKTAEAAPRTTPTTTPVLAETPAAKPGLLAGNAPLIGGSLIIIIVGLMLIFAGRGKKEDMTEADTTLG